MTQEALAERADLHWTYIGGIERGIRNPTLKNIWAIAQALEVSLSTLFDFEPPASAGPNLNDAGPLIN